MNDFKEALFDNKNSFINVQVFEMLNSNVAHNVGLKLSHKQRIIFLQKFEKSNIKTKKKPQITTISILFCAESIEQYEVKPDPFL